MTLYGVELRADGHSRSQDFNCLRLARLNAAKIKTNTDVAFEMQQIAQAGIPPGNVLLRLFVPMQGRRRYEVTPADFVDWMIPPLDVFVRAGGRFIEVHNEPNLELEGLGSQWMNSTEFNGWFLNVYGLLKARYPDKLLFGFPGLSPQPNVGEWLIACDAAYRRADWIGAHAYWRLPQDWNNPEEGYYFTRYFRFSKPTIVTEFSQKFDTLSAYEKGRAYAQYYASLPVQVLAAFAFVSSASDASFGWGPGASHETWVSESGVINGIPTGIASWTPPPPPPAVESGLILSVNAVGGWEPDLVRWIRDRHPNLRYGSVSGSKL